MQTRRKIALEINRLLRNQLKKEHPLRTLFWECTWRCNLSCKHCGSDCKNISTVPDMPAEDFLSAIKGVPPSVNIVITGGEPLMRKDLESVGSELSRRGHPWGIVSNGYMLTPERLTSLVSAGLKAITVSLDGPAEDHNWLRGRAESFDRASAAIRLISQVPGLVWDVVSCVNQRTLPKLAEFKDYLYSIGVRRWRLFTIFPAGRAALYPEFKLGTEQFRELLEFIKASRAEGRIKTNYCCEGFLGDYEDDVRDGFYNCHAGLTVGSILIDGSIASCPSIRADYHQGNIYQDDFLTVWNSRYQQYRDRSWTKTGQCANCKLFRYCEGGPMHLRDSSGNLIKHCISNLL